MSELYNTALATFAGLLEEAANSGMADPNAMVVASVDAAGRPSSRTVLLKAFDARGFVFYTHLESRKGRELAANPACALLFLWRHLRQAGIQVRIEGDVEQVEAAEADAYFASRPRMSQLGAWASLQSQTLPDVATFEQRLAREEARFADGPVPRPAGWTGLRVVPRSFEFWYGAGYRLHERVCIERGDDGQWSQRLLYP
ncbi:pyridoxine/pyridoxamine 5'-phosphate oxidase [Stenotrophomonas ginsengisoli]|uniref:Pyridoxine/pyridoxamine 5'-phosphate oxidase n=1 Tax=Stenotrophomonas ginsengisoli TaxID=336566 RepID=A0A0R0DCG9_9GAMM|nr:pyridoxamine 5'-phosphate oxidase [Stenotrophomonas ginsengisoli]KRG74931.1 pyridoxine/pyridoxamine 5'-phosphate oxidase [Stenotrophomonas ginsengisoli]